MQIPPMIFMGPPRPSQVDFKERLLVLTSEGGWSIVRWSNAFGLFVDTDPETPRHLSNIHPLAIKCWMYQDART